MTWVVSTPSDAVRPAGPPDEGESKLSAAEPSLQVEVAASELLLVLGEDYFKIPELSVRSGKTDNNAPVQPLRVDPHALAKASPPASAERDFWQDVAILSDKVTTLPWNQLGVKTDRVAYAIATVSAAYTLQASEQQSASKNYNVGPVVVKTPVGPSKDAAATDSVGSKAAPPDEPDLTDAILSLLGFEQTVAPEGARELDAVVMTETRLRAAVALVAAGVNRNSALKAAQGRKG